MAFAWAMFGEYTIEHIEPQSSTKMSIEQIASLGNLILVPQKLNNESLADRPFSEKKKIMAKNGIVGDEILQNATTWNAAKIDQRLKHMGELAYGKVWRL